MTTSKKKGYGVLQVDEKREQVRDFTHDGATRLTLPVPNTSSAWTLITTLDEHGNYAFAIENPHLKKVYLVEGNVNDFVQAEEQRNHERSVKDWEYDAACGCRICSAFETMSHPHRWPQSKDFRAHLLETPSFLATILPAENEGEDPEAALWAENEKGEE